MTHTHDTLMHLADNLEDAEKYAQACQDEADELRAEVERLKEHLSLDAVVITTAENVHKRNAARISELEAEVERLTLEKKAAAMNYGNALALALSRIKELEAEVERLKAVLDKLARLGNEPYYGNSVGNDIARQALASGAAPKTYTGTGPVPWKCVGGSECKHGWWCSDTYCQDKCQFRNGFASGAAPKDEAMDKLVKLSEELGLYDGAVPSQYGSTEMQSMILDKLAQKETDRG